MTDLWPDDFGTQTVPTPLAILREQAEVISKKTQSRVVGHVETQGITKGFLHVFRLIAPLLGDYSFQLFWVTHDLELYPLEIQADVLDTKFTCRSEEEFVEKLKLIFNSEKTKKVIQSILSQSDAVKK